MTKEFSDSLGVILLSERRSAQRTGVDYLGSGASAVFKHWSFCCNLTYYSVLWQALFLRV
jgi:hypothetical protein